MYSLPKPFEIFPTRLGRFTRKTLSFSKKKENHEAVLHMFLLQYNQDMKDKWITRQI